MRNIVADYKRMLNIIDRHIETIDDLCSYIKTRGIKLTSYQAKELSEAWKGVKSDASKGFDPKSNRYDNCL